MNYRYLMPLTVLLSLGCFCPVALHAALVQRVDATVSSSVLTNVSGVVIGWLDQSGSGNNASSLLGSVSFPSVSLSASGKAGLAFGPTSREALQLLNASATASLLNLQPGSSTNSGFAALVAFKCDALTNSSVSDWNDLIGNGDEGSPANGFLMRYSSGGTLQAYLNGSFIQKSGSPADQVAAGNTIVLAFNYNTNGSYEFWDSKSGTSLTGTKAATNFATGNVLKLGTTQNGNRYFKGMVGEVKLYNQVLSASGFKTEREQLAEKWANIPVNLPWRIIPADPNYPTDDVVIAALSVMDTAYLNSLLPADPANQDCTATFQEAINLVKNKGGGTIFVPAGHYRLDGRLDIPTGVTLRGQWQKPVAGQPIVGTILKAYAGRTNETSPPFIGLRGNSGVRDLAIWYPAQLPGDIQPYSPAMQGLSGGGFGVQNVTLVNAYIGFTTRLYEGGMGASPFVRQVYGTPLKTGLEFDQMADVGRVETVHFSPAFWAGSGLAGAPTSNQHAAWLRANGTGVILRRIDWSYYAYVTVDGYNIGLACRQSLWDDSTPNGQCYRFELTNCATGLYLEQSSYAGMQFTRFNIQNAGVGVQCVDTNNTSVSLFQSCTIAATNWAVRNTSNATLLFQNSSFPQGGIKFDSAGVLSVLNCDFGSTSSNHVELGASVEATLVGNRFVGGLKIANSSTRVVYVDHQPLTLDAMPPYEYGQPTNSFKPAQTNLYVITLAPYLAAADGLADDTAAFQAALSAAASAGGGTVLVPAGDYRLNGNLTIPTGVELRGVYDEPHGTSGRGSILNIYGGRNDANGTPFIQIQPFAGVRGLTFHYPEQIYNGSGPMLGMVPYPFTLRGLGSNIYVINVAATVPWQLLDLAANRCDNHYVDGIVAAALKTGVIVGNGSTDGRIMNCQLNPSQYGQSGGIYPSIPTSTYPDVFSLLNTQAYGYVLGKTVRQVFHQNFVFGALSGVLLADEGGSGPQGWSLGLGVDAGNKSLQANQVDAGGFDCINNQLVSLTTQSAYLVTSNGFNGKLRLFGLACWGNPAKGAEVNGGELQVQSGLIHHSTALTFDVNNTAKLAWQGGAVVTYANTLVQRDVNATANFTGISLNTATTQMPKTATGMTAIGNLCRNTTPTRPNPPTGLLLATINALVGLDWNNNAESDLNGYAVYRSTTSGLNFVQIATRLKTSDYSDTNALAGVTYYYRVTAVDTCSAEGVMSGQVAAQIYTPKLIQHLDATQPASVTVNSSGVVTSWTDLSGNGNHAASLMGEVGYPSASLSTSGKAGLAFGPTNREALQLLDVGATASLLNLQPGVANSGFAVLVAFKCDALTNSSVSDWNDLIGNGDEGSPANGFLMRYDSGGTMQAYLNGSFIQKSGSPANQVAVGNTIVLAFNYDTNGSYQFWDSKSGTSLTGTKAATNFATGNALKLGTTQNGSRYFKGMVGEVKLYNRVLDATTFGNERNALVAKWIQAPPAPAPTNLTCTVSGGALVLNWPNGVGWQLQSQTNGLSVGLNPASNAWFAVTSTSPYTNRISPTNPAVFFRLKWPAN
ncbi:MAG: Pectate lyase superfamily protein [Pedosphaera sp.]|nr:Pectate lyase superfamily protein [Pedosphaera sp.]